VPTVLDQQVFACVALALAGVAVGLWFDLLRAWRTVFRPAYWLAAVGDLLFWVVVAGTVGSALFLGNWGEMRLYVLVSLLAGLGAYWLCASRLVRLGLIGLLRLLVGTVLFLVELVRRLIWRPTVVLGLALYAGAVRLLGFLWRLLYWLLRPLTAPLERRLAPVRARMRSVYERVRAWLSPRSMD
jgi:spore cortex biosynthesis protein YabQ